MSQPPRLAVRLLSDAAQLPSRGTDDAAGLDLYACLADPVVIEPSETTLIPTGIAVEIPAGRFGLVKDRSSLALKGLRTSAGVIDADYRGELKIVLTNVSNEPFIVEPNARIAQMIVLAYERVEPVIVETLSDTARGKGGFGSTN